MNLGRDIKDYLFINKTVSMPGLGRLYLRPVSATLEKNSETLIPPGFKIEYDEDGRRTADLVSHIAAKYDISLKKADASLNKYIFGLLNKVLNYGKAEIPGLGFLSKTKTHLIVFEETRSSGFNFHNFLPQLKAVPIVKTQPVPIPAVAVPVVNPFDDKPLDKKKPEWLEYALPFIYAALLILVGYFSWKAYKYFTAPSEQNQTERLDNNPRLNKDPDSVLMSDLHTNEDQDERFDDASSMDSQENEPSFYPDGENSNPISPGDDESTPANPEDDLDLIESETEELDTSIGFSSDLDAADISPLYPPAGFADSKLVPYQIEAYKCVIIVGSYKKGTSVDNMLSKLGKFEFSSFTQAYQDYTRVGVVVECNDEKDLLQQLDQIKKEIEKTAWILH